MISEATFRKRLRRSLEKYSKDMEDTYRLVRQRMGFFMSEMMAEVSPVTDWDAAALSAKMRALDRQAKILERSLDRGMRDAANRVMATALAGVDEPLEALGLHVGKVLPFAPHPRLVHLMEEYIPGLIADVTADTRKEVAKLMRQAVAGVLRPGDLVNKLRLTVGELPGEGVYKAGNVFDAATRRAWTISRTEMQRVNNLTTTTRVKELSSKFPGVGVRWVHRPSNFPRAAHAALHGQVIYPDQGDRFNLGGIEILGPYDPELGAADTINCHCTTVVVYDAELNPDSVKDSPYIAGDGSDIPSATAILSGENDHS